MSFATLAQAAPSPTTTTPVVEEEEYYSSWSLFLVCLLLILSLWTSYYLQIKRIRAIHETVVSIFAGMFVGIVIRLAHGDIIREMLTFKHTLFFNLLLPPIILNSGYELKQENFFRNFGSILTFAFLGTFISAVGVGVLVYLWAFLGLESLDIPLLECLIFGSTLSATDPVTILAIFNQYKVDPKLYTVIFGESLLNDAVSIVMYETLSRFHGEETFGLFSLIHGTGIFLLTFSVSMALGVMFGLTMSLILKHSTLSQFPRIESCLVALSAYTCYFFSNGIQMSGIVSLLFCGITLKHYAYHTMSRRTQRTTKSLFAILAQLSENFIFVYLGLSLFTSPPSGSKVTSYFKPIFITITTVCVIFTRYAAVFPLSEAINFFHRHVRGQRQDELPHSYQMMLFWAGLRGAVGVALAAGFKGEHAQTLRTTVLVVVVLTVVLFGGTTARMLEVLGIRTGVEDEAASSDEEGEGLGSTWSRRMGRGARRDWATDYTDDDDVLGRQLHYPGQEPNGRVPQRVGMHYPEPAQTYAYNHHGQPMSPTHHVFSAASSDTESDGEVLPMAGTSAAGAAGPRSPRQRGGTGTGTPIMGEDGKWFQALDERYLIPLFSNATASRTFHAKKAAQQRRHVSGNGNGTGSAHASAHGTPAGSDDEGEGGTELDLRGRSGFGFGNGSGNGSGRGSAQNLSGMSASGTASSGLEDSRAERGLKSPMLRRDSTPQGSDRGEHT